MARKRGYDRNEVLQKALDVFWSRGYHATSLKDLESALDMRPGSIYAAFRSKENMFEESLQLYAKLSGDAFTQTVLGAPDPLTGLANHIREFGTIDRAATPSRACMLVKTVLETGDEDPVLRRTAEALLQDAEKTFADVFRRLQKAGAVSGKADPDRLASWLQCQIFGLRAYAQRSDASERIALLAEDIASGVENLRKAQ